MKKIITAVTLLFVSAQFFAVLGQKINRLPQRSIKTVEAPLANTSGVPGIKSAESYSDGRGVLLKWNTGSETDLIGFNVYRAGEKGNEKINQYLILSSNLRNSADAKDGSDYDYFDERGEYHTSYIIETVFAGGKKSMFNPLPTRFVSDLKNISGISSAEYIQSKTSAQPIVETSKPFLKGAARSRAAERQSIADPVNQKWVAAQPGVKLTVSKEGFYRVSRTELENAGFDVNAANNLWQLYFNGEEQSIIVEPSGQYIEFYAAPVEETLESDKNTYYLLVGANNGRRIDSRTVRPVGGTIPATVFYQLQTTKQKIYYVSNVRNGDAQNFFGEFVGDTPTNFTFNLKGVDYNIRKTDVSVTIQGISLTPHLVSIYVNGFEGGTVSSANRESMRLDFSVPTQYLNEGANTLTLTSLASSSDFSLFDSITVDLQRKYSADDNQLSFYTNDFRSCDLTGFTSSSIRIFDVNNPGRPTALQGFSITQQAGVYSANIPAFQTRKMYALTNEAIKQVDAIKPNVPSTLSTTAHDGQMVIIAHKNFLPGANSWATFRRADGLSVEVVDVEDIYDEFNFGKQSSGAIRDFAQYAETYWQTPPGYVLLIGDTTYDPHNYTGIGDYYYVPTRMVDTVYTETGSDDALTDFNDDGLAEIPIGRLPVRTDAQVTQLLNKVGQFEQTVAQGLTRGSLCASDLPNGYDFASLCTRVLNELPENVDKTYVNRGEANAGTVLMNQLNTGKYLVNYSGHGHTSIWAANGFFGNGAANSLTNANLSIFTMLTCLNGYFIEPASISLSETLLFAPNGGAVVTWSSSGLTTPDIQEIMGRRFYHQIGVGNMTRMGDLVNDAKTVINGGRDVRLSWVLLGDPTLKVR